MEELEKLKQFMLNFGYTDISYKYSYYEEKKEYRYFMDYHINGQWLCFKVKRKKPFTAHELLTKFPFATQVMEYNRLKMEEEKEEWTTAFPNTLSEVWRRIYNHKL